MQSLVFLACFYQKLTKKSILGFASTPLVKEGLSMNVSFGKSTNQQDYPYFFHIKLIGSKSSF